MPRPRGLKLVIALVVLIIIAIIVVPQFLFIVDETDQALVLRFGEFERVAIQPGLKIKIPFIETVTKFDKRLLRFDAPPETLITLDKKNLIIDAYARYKIVDPRQFFATVTDEAGADARLRDIIQGEMKKEIASVNQSDIILNQRASGFIDGVPTIVQAVLDTTRVAARDIGVEIIDVRIKRADFTETIQQSIFQRMNAERQQEAALFRAEGSEFDFKIRATADRTRTITIANAERDSSIIRGCGEAVTVKILASAFNKDPEFFNFQRSLEAYAKALGSGDTLVLESQSEFFRYLTDPSGILDGVLPAGAPAILGEAEPANIDTIETEDEASVVGTFTAEEIIRLVRDCERLSGFIKDIAGTVDDVEVLSTFEAGLTTTSIIWIVGGSAIVLTDLETQFLGDAQFIGAVPSTLAVDDVIGREVSIIARREPDETFLAIEVTFE
ncbi:MAG: protease modulator HflC [Chloroflexi bacterium]|nr:protease modulator HflC [Chloroflexota bacterium]